MNEIIKVKVDEVVMVQPDNVEVATPEITTDGKNIIVTQEQERGYVKAETKVVTMSAAELEENLKGENIVKGKSIFGVDGEYEVILQDKTITVDENGVIEVVSEDGYKGLSKVTVITNISPDLEDKTINITTNGETEVYAENKDGLGKVKIIVDVQPELQEKVITENGEYIPDERFYGLSKVTVNVQPELQEATAEITENGKHTITTDEAFYGMKSVEVNVNVQPNLQEKTATENGEVIPDDGYYGLSKVTVDYKPVLQEKTIEITENGETEVIKDETYDGIEKVIINTNVPDNMYLFVNGELVRYIDPRVTKVSKYSFYYKSALKYIDLQNAEEIETQAFAQARNVETIIIPKVKNVGDSAFRYNTSLKELKLDSIEKIGLNAFAGSANTSYITKVDMGENTSADAPSLIIGIAAFGNHKIETFIIRNTHSIYSLQSSSSLTLVSTGSIYVPDNLIDDYKGATNWATYADQIKPLSELVEE